MGEHSNYRTEEVHISIINAGDTVLHGEDIRTVCRGYICRCRLVGLMLFGDSYRSGYKPVTKVIFNDFRPEIRRKQEKAKRI